MALPRITKQQLLNEVARQFVAQHHTGGPQGALYGTMAGMRDASFGLADLPAALALTLNPNSPTHGDWNSSLGLQRAITKQELAQNPVSGAVSDIGTSILSGAAEMKGLGAVGKALMNLDKAPQAVKTAGNVLKAITEFRAAKNAETTGQGIGRVAGNLASAAAQGGIMGATHAAGTGGDVGSETGLGAVAGGAGGALGEIGGDAANRIKNLFSTDAMNALRHTVGENPDVLAARLASLDQRSGVQNPLASALNPTDAATVYNEAVNKTPATRKVMADAYNARRAQTPQRVADALNTAARSSPAPTGMDTSPIADMLDSAATRGPNPTVANFRAIQRADMDAAMQPIANTRLDPRQIPLYGEEQNVLKNAIRSDPSIRQAFIDGNGTLTIREMDSLRQQLSKAANRPSASPTEAQLYSNVADALTSHVSQAEPAYAEALKRYAAQGRLIDGFQYGQAGKDASKVEGNLDTFNLNSPEGRFGQQIGLLSGLRDKAQTPEAAITAARAIGEGGKLTAPASPAFGKGGLITEASGPEVAANLQERLAADTTATNALRNIADTSTNSMAKSTIGTSPADVTAALMVGTGAHGIWPAARTISTFLRASGLNQTAALNLSQLLANPETAQAALASLRQTHPNLGLTSQTLRALALGGTNADQSQLNRPTSDTSASQPDFGPSNVAGMLQPGNIDLNSRPIVHNPDGSYSTVRSISIDADGKTYLIPTVVNGKVVSNDEAIQHFKQTGENLGVFKDGASADSYAQQLHNAQAQQYDAKAGQEDWSKYPAVDQGAQQEDWSKYPAVSNEDGTWQNMIGTESGGNQFDASGQPLTSPKGAIGMAQVMPTTAPEAAAAAGVAYDPTKYENDPAYNEAIGYAYFNKLRDLFGDDAKAAAAYNAGPGAVQKALAKGGDNWLAHLPAETQNYVARATGS